MASKLVFFNRFFHPDSSATSQLVSDLAFHLAARGFEVHAVTSALPGLPPGDERTRGVQIHRVSRPSPGHGLVRRALAYLRFYRAARRWAADHLRPGDIAVLKTDPPLLGAAVGPMALRRGARVVNWLQDLFPEVAAAYGIPGAGGMPGAFLRRLRDRSLRAASVNVAIGSRMARHVASLPDAAGARVEVIHNWADGQALHPVDAASNTLREQWNLGGGFVVEYSGNLGRVHEFGTLLEAASHLRDQSDICFLIVGHGPRLEEVRSAAAAMRLANVRFEPHQPRERLCMSLAVGDAHVSTLHPRFEGLVHPSKLYGVMAVGRPMIFIGDTQGETAQILREHEAGIAVPTGEAQALAQAILDLRGDAGRRVSMGRNAREAFASHYNMPVAFARWEAVLASLDLTAR